MISVLLLTKISAVLFMLVISCVIFYKRQKSVMVNQDRFKHNISLLREEKLLFHSDNKLQKRRYRLINSRMLPVEDQKLLAAKSKKLGLSTGELILASKIRTEFK